MTGKNPHAALLQECLQEQMIKPQIPVAKEGVPFIGLSAFISLICAILDYDSISIFFLLLTLFILYFFRDPERVVPAREDNLVSPADGKIILIEDNQSHEFISGNSKKISIFMNVFNVHVNRTPLSGKVKKVIYTPGAFYSADSSEGDLKNERCAVCLETDDNRRIVFTQVAGLIARRIVCWLEPGDSIKRGERFGLIRFGSRVDLFLPDSVELDVQVGDTVRAGETPIATMK